MAGFFYSSCLNDSGLYMSQLSLPCIFLHQNLSSSKQWAIWRCID